MHLPSSQVDSDWSSGEIEEAGKAARLRFWRTQGQVQSQCGGATPGTWADFLLWPPTLPVSDIFKTCGKEPSSAAF